MPVTLTFSSSSYGLWTVQTISFPDFTGKASGSMYKMLWGFWPVHTTTPIFGLHVDLSQGLACGMKSIILYRLGHV